MKNIMKFIDRILPFMLLLVCVLMVISILITYFSNWDRILSYKQWFILLWKPYLFLLLAILAFKIKK